MIRAPEFKAFFAGETGAAEADGVESANGVIPRRDRERRQIFRHSRASLHKGEGADPNELMHEASAGNKNRVANGHVAREQGAVGKDDAIPNNRIMPDMGPGHKQVARTDRRWFAGVVGTVDGDVFAKNIVVADDHPGWIAGKTDILRQIANHGSSVKLVSRADARPAR